MTPLNVADKAISSSLASAIITAKNPIPDLKRSISRFRLALKERFEQGDPIDRLIRFRTRFGLRFGPVLPQILGPNGRVRKQFGLAFGPL